MAGRQTALIVLLSAAGCASAPRVEPPPPTAWYCTAHQFEPLDGKLHRYFSAPVPARLACPAHRHQAELRFQRAIQEKFPSRSAVIEAYCYCGADVPQRRASNLDECRKGGFDCVPLDAFRLD